MGLVSGAEAMDPRAGKAVEGPVQQVGLFLGLSEMESVNNPDPPPSYLREPQ